MPARISIRLDDETYRILAAEARARGIGLAVYLEEIATDTARRLRRERIREQSRAVGVYVASNPEARNFYEDIGTPQTDDC